MLEKGRVVESGSHAELVALEGLHCAMWRRQIGERAAAPAGRSRVRQEGEDAGTALEPADFLRPP